VEKRWQRSMAIPLAVAGAVFLCPQGIRRASAQYLLDAPSTSTFGNNANQLATTAAATSDQARPLAFGAGVAGNKSSLAGWQAYRNYLTGLASQGSGIATGEIGRVGPVKISLGAAFGVTYDSNINSSPTNPISDLYGTVNVNLAYYWKATRRNDLQISFQLNYSEYLRYSRYNTNGLVIDPYTGIDYRLYFDDFIVTFYEYPSITNNGGEQSPALTNSVNFQQLNNRAGMSVIWHPNKVMCMTGVERLDTISLANDDFNSQNSTGYSWFGLASYDITPTTNAGIRLQATSTTYTQQVMNDSVTARAGVFYQSRLTNFTSIYLEAGLQSAIFSNTGVQSNQLVYQESDGANTNVESTLGGSNYTQPYFQLTIMNRMTRYLSQQFSLSRQAQGSSVSNYQEVNAVGYSMQYRVNRVTTATAIFNYEFGSVSRTGGNLAYSDFTGQLSVSFKVMKNTDFSLNYIYYGNEMAELNASYTRQIFSFFISQRF
jgi:hypothetical protein